MNSCVLMAEIIKEPELRYTSDTQMAIADMLVQFPGMRPEDPLATLKVIGWGNLATEIKERYHNGDRVVIEGRLTMQIIERPEGFKEKRAELTASRIHKIGADTDFSAPMTGGAEDKQNVVPFESRKSTTPAPAFESKPEADYQTTGAKYTPSTTQTVTPNRMSNADLDDIPF